MLMQLCINPLIVKVYAKFYVESFQMVTPLFGTNVPLYNQQWVVYQLTVCS